MYTSWFSLFMCQKVYRTWVYCMNWNWNRNVCLVQLSNTTTLTSSFQTDKNQYCDRLTALSQTGEKREIYHFHYTTWPDFGVPESPASFLNFLFKVRESGSLGPEHGPSVVHCSAGIGRSGTFALVDTCLVLVRGGHQIQSLLKRSVA